MKKCLVLEAMEKCQCEYCKRIREWRDKIIKQRDIQNEKPKTL